MKIMNNRFVRVAAIALAVVLAAGYLIYQAAMFSDAYVTEIAFKTNENQYYDTKAYIVRNEKYITSDHTGTAVTMVKNSERVKKGDPVCLVFGSAEAAEGYTKKEDLDKEIARYERLTGQANLQALDVSSLNAQIKNRCAELMNIIGSGDLTGLQNTVGAFRDGVTSLQIATGTNLGLDDKLNALKAERSGLSAAASAYSIIKASETGYYTSLTDGYENKLSVSDIRGVSSELLESLLTATPAAVPENVSGKLIMDFKWYILCTVESKYFGEVGEGDTVYVDFPQEGVNRLQTKVSAFEGKNAEKTVLVLECSMMNEAYTRLRAEDMRIITDEHDGIKISREAVRVIDGVQGVYVLTGNIVRFRKINVVYATDEYVLSGAPQDGAEGYIRLYDEVIIKGEDLHDGMLAR